MTKQELDQQIVEKKLAELSPKERLALVTSFAGIDFNVVIKPLTDVAIKFIKLNLIVEKNKHTAGWGVLTHVSDDKSSVLVLTSIGKLVIHNLTKTFS